MFATLASLILDAIGMLVRRIEIVLPEPLQQMAPILHETRSVRATSITTEARNETVQMNRAELVLVRSLPNVHSHMVLRTFVGGATRYLERVSNEDGSFLRQDVEADWTWQPPSTHTDPRRIAAVERLNTDIHWTTLEETQLNRQTCLAYRALQVPHDEAWTQIHLWIAKDSLRPVEMLALSFRKGVSIDLDNLPRVAPVDQAEISRIVPRSQTLSSQIVIWGEWDDPLLSIPSL